MPLTFEQSSVDIVPERQALFRCLPLGCRYGARLDSALHVAAARGSRRMRDTRRHTRTHRCSSPRTERTQPAERK